MRRNLLLGFCSTAILMASLHVRRNSSKRDASSSEASYRKRIAFTDSQCLERRFYEITAHLPKDAPKPSLQRI